MMISERSQRMHTNEVPIAPTKKTGGSDRSFGIVFAAFFGLVGFWPLWSDGALRLWAVGTGILFLTIALIAPRLLGPLNWLWTKIGLALHHIVNPVVMALIYFGAAVPTAYVLRMRGKDLLRLKHDPDATSYWIRREPPAPAPGSMSKQF